MDGECDGDSENTSKLQSALDDTVASYIFANPNFFGSVQDFNDIVSSLHANKSLAIMAVYPISMGLIQDPGSLDVDIVCGEGQPLGVPLASGGPYFGFMCCRKEYVRQLPGRIVGRTHDAQGREGFVLTLQAREQHIRRAKATSNICTNQGLMVTAATIYMSLLGASGLREVAVTSHQRAMQLLQALKTIEGVELAFQGPIFHEFVLRLTQPVDGVLKALQARGIQGGYALTKDFPELGESLLVCATETKTPQELQQYQDVLAVVLKKIAINKAAA